MLIFTGRLAPQVLEEIFRITQREGRTSVIVVTTDLSDRSHKKAEAMGASRVIVQHSETSFDELVRAAIEPMTFPENQASDNSVQPEIENPANEGDAETLGSRDIEVLRLLANGIDTVRIARQLNYSERTIKSVIQRIVTVLSAQNRVHAVATAIRMGLIRGYC
ncbi:response regulator transcription factor [Streptomyces sp. NPDC090080]|uniref:response regulator transcription factor n=1 Tax=Streptomyces sp. NPDC090080 TaxID=3365939 RepID=UPI0037F4B665